MPKQKSKRSKTTAWSEWVWDEDRKQWKRYRGNGDGYEYEWRDPEPATSSTSKGKEPEESAPTAWSDWALDKDRNQWKRYRGNGDGYEYEWRDPEPATSSTSKGNEPEESAKEGNANLSVVLYKPRWGNLHHWALHLDADNRVYEVTGEAMDFKAEYKAGIIPSSSGSWVKSIHVAKIQPADVDQLHGIITETEVQNDVTEWCCQDYVMEALEALNVEQIVDDEDYGKAKKRLMKRFNH